MNAISLFSNCGAGDLGYMRAGFEFRIMAELQAKRLEVCLLNHPDAVGVPGDLRSTWNEVLEIWAEMDIEDPLELLAACPPCQGMSSARGLRGDINDPVSGSQDERNLLAIVIANIADQLLPKMVVVENVPAFLTRKVLHPDTGEPIAASRLLINRLSDRYYYYPVQLDMADFGIPQSRERTFITFIRRGLGIGEFLEENDLIPYPNPWPFRRTVEEAFTEAGLAPLDARSPHTAGTGFHSVPVLDSKRYNMISAIPPYSGKSAWYNNTCINCSFSDNSKMDVYCQRCGDLLPKPTVKNSDGGYRLIKGFATSYKRMSAGKPSATILTASGHLGSHTTLHPYENRLLSIAECALLQTMDEFEWGDALDKWGGTNVRAMIGEAVPPRFTEQHGLILYSLLDGIFNVPMMTSDDKRHRRALKKLNEVE